MNKQMFLKLILMTTSKYILSRFLKIIDNKLCYQQTDETDKVFYSCKKCNYVSTKFLIHVHSKCPCCQSKKLDVLASDDINSKNITTISKILNNVYRETF